MIGWDITWIAEGYAASNSTISVANDIIDAIKKFLDTMKQMHPTTKIEILAVRRIQ
jgi:hypothetical protein